jgi:hypothetical protein
VENRSIQSFNGKLRDELQDFPVEGRLISRVGDHLGGSTGGAESDDWLASANPRLGIPYLIADSLPQVNHLEVADERDAIVAVETAGKYSGLVV